MHDTTLERTTGQAGSVAESMGWSELSRLDAGSWHGSGYTAEPIPRLADIATFCLQTGSTLNIEIKPTPGHDETTGAGVAEQAARLWHGQPRQPLLSSFSPRSLAAARQSAPQLPRALLLDTLDDDWLDQALQLDCRGVVMHHPLIDQATASTLHEAGLFLMSYTVNEPSVAEQLLAWDVDGLITDVMDRSSWPGAAQLR
jgi:glycerophosphoryl diester phosphodiesterase